MGPAETCAATSARGLATALTLAWLSVAAAQDQCDGPLIQLQVHANATDPAPRTLYGVLAAFGGIPSFNLTEPTALVAAQPRNACGELQPGPPSGAVYLVERGGCAFTAKYAAVLAAGGSGMLLFDDQPGCVTMGAAAAPNASANGSAPAAPPAPRNASQPPAVSLEHSDGLQLLAALQGPGSGRLLLRLQLLDVPALDASALLLWLMAVGTVVGGSLWSGADCALELKAGDPGSPRRAARAGSGSGSGSGSSGLEVLEISSAGAVAFVALASAVLLALYFFLSDAFFALIVAGFCLAGTQALAAAALPPLTRAAPTLAAARVRLPCALGVASGAELVALPLALGTCVLWALARNAPWSWVLQDTIGIAIMLLVLRTLRLPSLRVACVLLPLCFAYDVWWVFLQPLVTGGGTSVMVEVAGGGASHEFLPMLLRVPRLSGPPIIRGSYSLLGFGDIILPGLLVALTRRLEVAGARGGYFVTACLGYALGLVATYAALMLSLFGDQGQPALLYLVPSTLGAVCGLAACRGELRALWDAGREGGAEPGSGAGGAGAGLGAYRAVLTDEGDASDDEQPPPPQQQQQQQQQQQSSGVGRSRVPGAASAAAAAV